MKQYSAEQIRNVAFGGHGDSGKTSLAEAAFFLAGATDRLGKIADSNTFLDFDPEEKKRKTSVSTAVASLEWKGSKINIIDTPGLFDFASGLCEGMRAADVSVMVMSGKAGVSVGTEKAFKEAKLQKNAKMFFVSKMDGENVDFYKVFAGIKEAFGSAVCPIVIPHVVDGAVQCYVNLLDGKAYTYKKGKASEVALPEFDEYDEMLSILNEAVASVDDDLMEKYFSGESFTPDELIKGLTSGMCDDTIYPVYCGAGFTMEAVDLFLDGLAAIAAPASQAAGEKATLSDGSQVDMAVDPDGDMAAIVFKTIADPFVGKLSYFKVISGKFTGDCQVVNARTGQTERVSKVMYVKGAKQEDAQFITAGDIGAVAKLASVKTGDTLCAPSKVVTLKGVGFPAPCLSMAIKPKAKGDEEKIAQGLLRLLEEDPTISFESNVETRQQILSGLGEQHLDVITSKVKAKFGVDVMLEIPKVAYRETIRKKVRVQGRHKKQSGGHGQFGDVWIEFEHCDDDDLVFEEKIFGGSVPRGFFPAVEKGLRDCISKGVLAGYPVVGLKAILVDGSYHPVDSSEMSFKLAAAIAYKNGLPQASPVILEPIGALKVLVGENNMGDIIGEVNKRRGRVLGMDANEAEKMQEVIAEVPMAEMGDFSTMLRSVTQGRGSFSLTFERYEEAPAQIAQKVIEQAKKDEEE